MEHSFPHKYWVGLHDNVPDRVSAKVALIGCQLATMALKMKTVTIPPKRWVARQTSPKVGRQCIWAELHETGGLSATLSCKSDGTLSCNTALIFYCTGS